MSFTAIRADAVVSAEGRLGDTIVIEDGKVAAIGDGLSADHTVSFDGVITPGLRDAHFHPATYTASLIQPVLKDAADMAEVGDRLSAAAAKLDPGSPVVGLRLDDEHIAEGRLPTRADLDAITNDNGTKLWDLNPLPSIIRIAKAIRTDHRTGLKETFFTNLHAMVNGHICP